MYADDLILLGTSVTDLQYMFNICEHLLKLLDLPINISKCYCLRRGQHYKVRCGDIRLSQSLINWVESIDYLGQKICRASSFKCCWGGAIFKIL